MPAHDDRSIRTERNGAPSIGTGNSTMENNENKFDKNQRDGQQGQKPRHKFNRRRGQGPRTGDAAPGENTNGEIRTRPDPFADLAADAAHAANRRKNEGRAEKKESTPAEHPAEGESRDGSSKDGASRQGRRSRSRRRNHRSDKPEDQEIREALNEMEAAPAVKEASEAVADDNPAAPQEGSGHTGKRRPRRRGGRGRGRRNPGAEEAISANTEPQETAKPPVSGEYEAYAGIAASDPEEEEIRSELNSAYGEEAFPPPAIVEKEPLPEAEPSVTYEIVGIRFKEGGKVYYFDPAGFTPAKGEAVIVETARGIEFGICDIANRMVSEKDVVLPLRKVLRMASAEDRTRHEENLKKAAEAYRVCALKIAEHRLPMKLVDVELAFDSSKLLFYFTADGRIDFRELVKDLASVFRTRIELRQIGIRDETKLIGGIGICGRPFCCKSFLSDFVQVSIKMAKEQNLSLNSAKISGACGRLMCCLRYEYDTYQEEIRRTPKVDQIVTTPDGTGTVIEVQPLAGLVRVRFNEKTDAAPKVFHRDEVKVIGGKGFKPPKPAPEAVPVKDSEPSESAPEAPAEAHENAPEE